MSAPLLLRRAKPRGLLSSLASQLSAREFASAVVAGRGGAFVLRRTQPLSDAPDQGPAGMPQPPSPSRNISSSRAVFCNIMGSDLEQPFGQHDVEEELGQAAMTAGGSVVFGASRISQPVGRVLYNSKPHGPLTASWIGSKPHAGDFTRLSSTIPKKPDVQSPVWAKIISACREDPATLTATVNMFASLSKESQMAPPLPAFNKLLEIASKSSDMEVVHKLVAIMDDAKLEGNEETQKQLDACFAYNNRTRSD